MVTFKPDGSNKQAETFSPDRPDPTLFPLLPFPQTISSRQLAVVQHTFAATGDGRRPKEEKKDRKKKQQDGWYATKCTICVVFPVSVVSRCPRQISEWKG